MPARTSTALLSIAFAYALLVAAPLPKPRAKEPQPDLIFSAGKYERFDGKVTIDLWQADDGQVEIGVTTPDGNTNETLATKSGDFWAFHVESKDKYWIYGNGNLHCITFKGDNTISKAKMVGVNAYGSAPEALRDAMPKDEKMRLVLE